MSGITTHRKLHVVVQPSMGLHSFPGTIRPQNGPLYKVGGLFLGVERFNHRRNKDQQVRIKGKYSIGITGYYYEAYYKYILLESLFPNTDHARRKAMNLVFHAGYEWMYGRFSIFIQGGLQLYAPALQALNKVWDLPKHGPIYMYTANKLGYKLYLYSPHNASDRALNAYLFAAVKTVGGTADFFETGIGVVFGKRNSWK